MGSAKVTGRSLVEALVTVALVAACQERAPSPDKKANPQSRIPEHAQPVVTTSPAGEGFKPLGVAELAARARCGADEVTIEYRGARPGSLSGDAAPRCPDSPSTQLDLGDFSADFYVDPKPGYREELKRRGFPGFIFQGESRRSYPRDSARAPFSPSTAFEVVECYYLGCLKLDVSDFGIATEGSESCILVAGGTSHPARSDRSCPAAVRIAGEYRALKRSSGKGSCCYGVPAPVPP